MAFPEGEVTGYKVTTTLLQFVRGLAPLHAVRGPQFDPAVQRRLTQFLREHLAKLVRAFCARAWLSLGCWLG